MDSTLSRVWLKVGIYALRTRSGIIKDAPADPGHPWAWDQPEDFVEHQQLMRKKQENAAPDIPPVCVISLQKSGSSLVTAILHTGLNIPWCCIGHKYSRLDPAWLRWLAQGRTVTHDHLEPSIANLRYLLAVMPRIAVHVRDPRAAAVSQSHHEHGMVLPEHIENVYINFFLPWLDRWLAVSEAYPNQVKIFRYEDLSIDPTRFFRELTEWLRVPDRHFAAIEEAISKQMNNRNTNNYRRGVVDGWRDELPVDFAEDLWARTPMRVKAALE